MKYVCTCTYTKLKLFASSTRNIVYQRMERISTLEEKVSQLLEKCFALNAIAFTAWVFLLLYLYGVKNIALLYKDTYNCLLRRTYTYLVILLSYS